jgi:fatty acid amide hydrolase
VTIKESLDLQGLPSTVGIPARVGELASSDAPAVARLRTAGAIPIAKTNVAQALIFTETDNPVYGRTNNPWNPERSSGGSSGGEAAIVAAGGSPLGLGSDIGGSVRIPAAFCGVVGFRPSAGRVPDAGRLSVPLGQTGVASQVGLIARHVADIVGALSAINGEDLDDRPSTPFGDVRTVDLSRLRIAVVSEDGIFPPAPAYRRAVGEAARMLKNGGAAVATWRLPAPGRVMQLFHAALFGDRGAGMSRVTKGGKLDPRVKSVLNLARMPRPLLVAFGKILALAGQPSLAGGVRLFGHGTADQYWQTVEAIHDYRTAFLAALADDGRFDAVVLPAYAVPAVRHGATLNLPLAGIYTLIVNVLGFPAGVVPVTRVQPDEETERTKTRDVVVETARQSELASAGLPIAVQVMGKPWQDHVALAVMQAIQSAAKDRPDYPARPPL